MGKQLLIIPELTEKDSIKFWSKVNTNGTIPKHCLELGPCWLWLGHKNKVGRGTFTVKGITLLAPRIAFTIYRGPISLEKPYVLHKCDNPSCLRDEHLFDGTQADNMKDMYVKARNIKERPTTKGNNHWSQRFIESRTWGKRNGAYTHPERVPRGDRSGARTHPESIPRGEKSGASKLTNVQVLKIREEYNWGNKNMTILAKENNVSIANIFRIVNRQMWKHI